MPDRDDQLTARLCCARSCARPELLVYARRSCCSSRLYWSWSSGEGSRPSCAARIHALGGTHRSLQPTHRHQQARGGADPTTAHAAGTGRLRRSLIVAPSRVTASGPSTPTRRPASGHRSTGWRALCRTWSVPSRPRRAYRRQTVSEGLPDAAAAVPPAQVAAARTAIR